jgi:phage tail protein X
MNKKTAIWHLVLSALLITAVSCSSKSEKDSGATDDIAAATADGGEASDPNALPADAGMAGADAPPPTDANAAPTDPNAPAPETKEGDVAKTDQPPTDAAAPGTEASAAAPTDPNAPPADANATPPPATDAAATPQADASATPPAEGAGQGDLFGAGAAGAAGSELGSEPTPKKSGGKLAHIKDAPFSKGKQNLNTVYIARDGDTIESVSQKLFGEDKSKMLLSANPTLKKGVKTGDKVYFNSPNRADDKEHMMTVYEDQGLPPTTYTTKDGDTLKSLAQEWYGSEASYKEIYAINKSLTSTKELPAGTELQYWPATVNIAAYGAQQKEAEMAAAAPPPPPPPSPASNGLPPTGLNNGLPPPPGAIGSVGGPPPPGGAPNEMVPPPMPDMAAPPPPVMAKKKKEAPAGMDKDTIMYSAAAGVLLIGSGVLMAIRRRNARRGGVTQV